MAEYDSARALATRLLAKKGRTVTLRRIEDGVLPDADRPWEPNATKSNDANDDFTCSMVVFPFNRSEIDGTDILVGDKRGYISPAQISDLEINNKFLVIDGSNTYRIVDIDELTPGAQKVLYTIQLRGA